MSLCFVCEKTWFSVSVSGAWPTIGGGNFQEYPCSALGHIGYSSSQTSAPEVQVAEQNFDPKEILQLKNSPSGYLYERGFFLENGKEI